MDNWYVHTEIARMRHEDTIARSERSRLMAENGLDLLSILRRAVAERLVRLPRVRFFTRSAPAELHLVSRAQLERRVDSAA